MGRALATVTQVPSARGEISARVAVKVGVGFPYDGIRIDGTVP